MTTLLKAQLRRSLKSVPTVEAQDAVSAELDSMMARQRVASQSRSYGAVGDFLAGLRAQVERPRPIGYEDEPELTRLPDDEGDDAEEEEYATFPDEPLTERQAITADIYEAMDVDRQWGREDAE